MSSCRWKIQPHPSLFGMPLSCRKPSRVDRTASTIQCGHVLIRQLDFRYTAGHNPDSGTAYRFDRAAVLNGPIQISLQPLVRRRPVQYLHRRSDTIASCSRHLGTSLQRVKAPLPCKVGTSFARPPQSLALGQFSATAFTPAWIGTWRPLLAYSDLPFLKLTLWSRRPNLSKKPIRCQRSSP